jgi:hypothetical protein
LLQLKEVLVVRGPGLVVVMDVARGAEMAGAAAVVIPARNRVDREHLEARYEGDAEVELVE